MAEADEVPDDQKERSHLLPLDEWKRRKALAAEYAKEDTDDIDVPEPDDEDWDEVGFAETPDELTREETL